MTVDVDNNSGFCAGVIRAIDKAEEYLDKADVSRKRLYSLGAIVHNESELNRLASKGLVTIDREDLSETRAAEGETLLIRAHGEPPETYRQAESIGFNIICAGIMVSRGQDLGAAAADAEDDIVAVLTQRAAAAREALGLKIVPIEQSSHPQRRKYSPTV